jgi:uncharacterized protein
MSQKNLRVAAIGDLHTHETSVGLYKDFFTEISEHADVLLLCGDVTNLGLPQEAENLAKDIILSKIPVVGVLGNHDHHSDKVPEIKKILREANFIFLDDETFELNSVGFAGVKGYGGGFDNFMLGAFGEEATKKFVSEAVNEALKLENSLKALNTKTKVVALHYSPIAQTMQGERYEIFPFLGCSRFAETIDRFDNVAAVFHGHAHHGIPEGQTKKGIPVFNCSWDLMQKFGKKRPFAYIEIPLKDAA